MAYSKYSVFYNVPVKYQAGLNYLDFNIMRNFRPDVSDTEFTITQKYHLRPDLLSNELYGSPELCHIFALRNPDQLSDLIYDFTAGKVIMVPSVARVRTWSN